VLKTVVDSFTKFVDRFENNKETKHFKSLFYAVLKTEGEILIEID